MVNRYMKTLSHLAERFGIVMPTSLRVDQTLTPQILDMIEAGVDAIAEGTATVDEVMAGKTFTSQVGVNKTGTYVPPTIGSLTADADATANDIIVGKIAYAKGVKLTGASDFKLYYASLCEIGTAFTEEQTTDLLAVNAGTFLIFTHGTAAQRLYLVGKKADESELYFVGGSTDLTTGVATLYSMTAEVTAGVASITSIKTADGTEDITNWSAATGSLCIYK